MIQHPLFEKQLVDLKWNGFAQLANRFLSNGAASYYLGGEGINTRLHLYNYFALLNAQSFHATWRLRAYSTDGRRSIEHKGEFADQQNVAIEMQPIIENLGKIGLCVAYISPSDHGRTLRTSYPTIYYAEYYSGQGRTFIHSLGYPVPNLYNANDYIVSSLKEGSNPFLILSNSCKRIFRTPKVLATRGSIIEIQNHQKQQRHFKIDPINPLACRKISLLTLWPDLYEFLDSQPMLMRLRGPNILYSPLFMQNGKDYVTAEHFQGLDWEEL